MAYIYPAPGNGNAEVTLKIEVSGDSSPLAIPALQDITINNSNDVFSWTQLDQGSKLQIATTATNSLSMNLVLDQGVFFGATSAGNVAVSKGVFGLSKDKTKIAFDLYLGDEDDGTAGKFISGEGYITGLAPTVSADSPVWVSPITITVDGDYTVGDSATVS